MKEIKTQTLKPVHRIRSVKEVKMMKFINIFVICFVAVFLVIIVGCALNGMGDMAVWLAGAILVVLWNYRIIRRKYARGL